VLDFPIGANGGSLAVGLDLLGRHDADEAPGQFSAKFGCDAQDLRAKILDEAFAGPWVAQHRRHHDEAHRLRSGLAAFDEGFLDEGLDLAQAVIHEMSTS
jgi:hypothetical protein